MASVRLLAQFLLAIALEALAPGPLAHPALPSQAELRAMKAAPATDPVDINSASLDQLMKIPGLPRTWAARIIRFRPYRAKNELLDRGIVTSEVYARIKDHIIAHRAYN